MENTDFRSKPKYLAPLEFREKAENNFDVLTTKEEIQRIAIQICTEIHHPVTIIDANRIADVVSADDAEKIRINSEAEYFSLREACGLFRKCAGPEMCHKCDHYHASKFSNKIKFGNVDYNDHPDFFNDEYEKNLPEVISVEGFHRPVFEYHCPMFGYRELLIPLFFNERGKKSKDGDDTILGIVFIGQSVVESEGDINFVKNAKESFFKKNDPERLFMKSGKIPYTTKYWIIEVDGYLSPLDKLRRTISNEQENEIKDNTMNFLNMDEYRKFIESTCKYIRDVEKNLTEIFIEKRKNYFRSESERIVEEYFSNVETAKAERQVSENQESYSELLTAWNELISATDSLKETFKIKGIYVFGDGTSLTVADNEKKSLYSKNYNSDNGWLYDFSVPKGIGNDTFYTSFSRPEIVNGLEADIDKENCFIISYSDIALLFCIKNLKVNVEKYKDLAEEIGTNFARIHSHIALVAADFMQEKLVTTLRINRHETAHISTRLKDDIYVYFSEKGQTFTQLYPEKQANIVDDLSNTTSLLSNMANNVGIITGSINKDNIKHKTDNLNVYDLLNKWRVMFKDRLVQRNLNLEFVFSYNPGFSPIFTVPELFELMIYNLVDNAVKYAYRGTNIYMHWEKAGKDKSVFSIINYGSEIKKQDRIFDLYTRGGSAEKSKKIEGDGIGLYSVKKISELLGCNLIFNAETDNTLVSEYNLPLIEWCKIKKSTRAFFDYDINVLEAFNEKFPSSLKREIINITHTQITGFDVSVPYLNSRINDKIFKTVFTVEVPHELILEEK